MQVSVMVRGMLERVLGAEQLDEWYAPPPRSSIRVSYCFPRSMSCSATWSSVSSPRYMRPYRDRAEEIGRSIVSVYNELNGMEPHTSAERVRYSAATLSPITEGLGGRREPWLAGYRLKLERLKRAG